MTPPTRFRFMPGDHSTESPEKSYVSAGASHKPYGMNEPFSVQPTDRKLAAGRRGHDPALRYIPSNSNLCPCAQMSLIPISDQKDPAPGVARGGRKGWDYFRLGREAAATDWPTRRVFSSGSMTSHLAARSGNSSARISLQTRRMVSPPLPDMTRPSIIICSML